MKNGLPKHFGFLIVLLTLVTSGSSSQAVELVLVEVPADKSASSTLPGFGTHVSGARIVALESGSAESVILTPEFDAACDPDVSFDGDFIIFAGKKTKTDRWQIWRMRSDGSNKVQVTTNDADHFSPVHAGTRFYLNDPAPTPQVIFAGTEHGWQNRENSGPLLSLYGTDPTGRKVHRLPFNLYDDYAPAVLPTGRIVFTSSKGLPRVGFQRSEWNSIKYMTSGTIKRTIIDDR